MSKTRYLTVVETAKLLRPALKSAFPGVKFSVRSNSYSGGASIDVFWTDGPRESEVDKVLNRYEGATFDGMIDLKSYHTTILSKEDGTMETVHMGADYVFPHREMSAEAKAAAEPAMLEFYGEGWDLLPEYTRETALHRYLVLCDIVDGEPVLSEPEHSMKPYDGDAKERAMHLFSMKAEPDKPVLRLVK